MILPTFGGSQKLLRCRQNGGPEHPSTSRISSHGARACSFKVLRTGIQGSTKPQGLRDIQGEFVHKLHLWRCIGALWDLGTMRLSHGCS